VVIHLNGSVPLITSPQAASLIDETDQGFYVILAPDKKALFLPRSAVASVYFGSLEDLRSLSHKAVHQ
jgi:hypothetical protein